jgi:hypothetical protein
MPSINEVPASGHDLPVLAATRPDLPVRPDWPSLLEDGIQPALILGAERRMAGDRKAG